MKQLTAFASFDNDLQQAVLDEMKSQTHVPPEAQQVMRELQEFTEKERLIFLSTVLREDTTFSLEEARIVSKVPTIRKTLERKMQTKRQSADQPTVFEDLINEDKRSEDQKNDDARRNNLLPILESEEYCPTCGDMLTETDECSCTDGCVPF